MRNRQSRFTVWGVATVLIASALVASTLTTGLVLAEKDENVDPAGETGFVTLFDGKTLEGWTLNHPGGYVVENGVIVCLKSGGGFLYTDKEYGDFDFRFEFKLTADANNGVGIRTPKKADPAYEGMEIQILDNSSKKWPGLNPWQIHGSIYGVAPAKRGHLKPIGEWNSEEIICRGKHVIVRLNGVTIVDADIEKASTPHTLDGHPHPGLKREKGFIAFCGHGSRVEFRNVRIKPLDAE